MRKMNVNNKILKFFYRNWMLGMVIVACMLFMAYKAAGKLGEYITQNVKYPAHYENVIEVSSGEHYYIANKYGFFSVTDEDCELIYLELEIRSVVFEGDFIEVVFKDGRREIINLLTKEIMKGVSIV